MIYSNQSVYTRRLAAIVIGLVLAFIASAIVDAPKSAQAASASNFDPGLIISDALFYDSDAMSEAEIQAFLVEKGSALVSFRGGVGSRPRLVSDATGNVRCEPFEGGSNLAASTIIYRAQASCGISAKVILVTLQKEQGLILKSTASTAALDRAMGYACPDTAPCAPTTLGFGNQVYMGTLQLNTYKASKFSIQPGVRSIQYHPNTACGASSVNIRNYATAALYAYTPYQPNASALANLYGAGDSCGSYGNRNFFVFYSDWFGSPVGAVNPVGAVESVSVQPGSVRLSGWAFDPDTTESISVHIYIGGVGHPVLANESRPDVDRAYGGVGASHGFGVSIPASAGTHELCAYGINQLAGSNTLISCHSVTVPGGSPIGAVESVSATPTAIAVSGWAIDPDTAASVAVHVYVGSVGVAVTANHPRSDIGSAYPAYGEAHGYGVSIPASPGVHTVCAYGINSGAGVNTVLGCRNVTVL
ncbi:MAG: hypothetical protein JWR57_942 [Mycetocola sp.]|nr:hypothetical protein [Mycetocola sp.]